MAMEDSHFIYCINDNLQYADVITLVTQ
jgi:hypothetical protein